MENRPKEDAADERRRRLRSRVRHPYITRQEPAAPRPRAEGEEGGDGPPPKGEA